MSINFMSTQTVTGWIRQKFQQRNLHQAIVRAYTSFERRHRKWTLSLFDEQFLTRYLDSANVGSSQITTLPEPAALARAWAAYMTSLAEERKQELVAEATPVAADFLRLLAAELRHRKTSRKRLVQAA